MGNYAVTQETLKAYKAWIEAGHALTRVSNSCSELKDEIAQKTDQLRDLHIRLGELQVLDEQCRKHFDQVKSAAFGADSDG